MSRSGHKPNVALLAVPEGTASTIFGMYDLFSSVGRDWDMLHEGRPGTPLMAPRIAARDKAEMRVANGARLQPDITLEDDADPQIVCVPELLLMPDEPIADRFAREGDWLAEAYRRGAVVASASSGSLLLAEAGLLDGRKATTHWAHCASLQKRYPSIKVQAASVLVTAGDDRRIITSGGGTSWQNVVLFLVARYFGLDEAMRLAKVRLLDWHQGGQLPFSSVACPRQDEDRIIASCQHWIAENYAAPSPVAAMMRLSGLTERTFKRRFTKATGMPPIDYVHTLRLEQAQTLLETTRITVEAVANEVGYEDTTFFRRLFRRRVGLAPREYRARVGALRTGLREAART
ncbi:MAG: helix-turn-helix domain-containing protein [Arenicellales bacterium]